MRSSASFLPVNRRAADIRLKTELKAPKGVVLSATHPSQRDSDEKGEEVVTFTVSLGPKTLAVMIVLVLDLVLRFATATRFLG